jgi:glycosyltransferase involved in cell wall biosynthesis
MPYSISLFCLSHTQLDQLFSTSPSWLRLKNRLNVGVPPLSGKVPDTLPFHLGKMDAVAAFIESTGILLGKEVTALPYVRLPHTFFSHKKGIFDRVNFGLPENELLIGTYIEAGISPARQKLDTIIAAYRQMKSGTPCRLVIILDRTLGLKDLVVRQIRSWIGTDGKILFFEGMAGDEETQSLFSCCDVVCKFPGDGGSVSWLMEMMHEGKPAVTCACGAQFPVSLASAEIISCQADSSSCTPDQEQLRICFEELIDDEKKRKQRAEDAHYETERHLSMLRSGAVALVTETFSRLVEEKRERFNCSHTVKRGSRERALRILFQNRPDMFERPGGDTTVLYALKKELEAHDLKVDISNDPFADLNEYDIVHTFNSTLSVFTDAFARNAIAQKKPFAVTSLQEDFPRYITRARLWFEIFARYVDSGQNEQLFDRLVNQVSLDRDGPVLSAPLTLSCAGAIFTSGKAESDCVEKWFPETPVIIAPFGIETGQEEENGDLFRKTYGLEDFILCVGRLEARKNQLMLLKALECDDHPLVFVTGGVSYQPAYGELCRKFKRKATTLFLDRLEREMLVSAYRACSVHVLPSWYELPGLVTIEAAGLGCRIVASSWGTTRDYVGDEVTWCEPDNPASVHDAVMKACATPASPVLAESISRCTWKRSAEIILEAYDRLMVHGNNTNTVERPESWSAVKEVQSAQVLESVTRLVEKKRYREAIELYETVRATVERNPELRQFDTLMKQIREKSGIL